MKNQILNAIDSHQEECFEGLKRLIELESSDGKSTKAQSLVSEFLKSLNYEVSEFSDLDPRVLKLEDYCPYDFEYDENAYNVAGIKRHPSDHPSLLLFAHIDTEAEDYFGKKDNPYKAYEDDEKIYGLGASDDKAGIMMMLYALKFVSEYTELPYNTTILSILGKHGGAKGTLSALLKGYTADYGIYLHPAETGAGFAEIKNISLGVLDYDLIIHGQDGKAHDDLDPGTNAIFLANKVLTKLENYNQQMRNDYRFDFGSFKDEPSFILNVGQIHSDYGYGGIPLEVKIQMRIRFFHPLTMQKIKDDLNELFKEDPNIELRQGNFRASPAMVETDEPFIQMLKKNIEEETGIKDFIHQYHGGSDLRLPILYGNCKCIGIGPSCKLPKANSNEDEWILKEDYIHGIKILAGFLIDFIHIEDNL